ncbi:hypothetical protein [uncultured Algibacter sp.]|uniref:hypothetical protein n=1 Tax=uncultured Algibacter sp. TaxID=298659 RepID=UPI0032180A84
MQSIAIPNSIVSIGEEAFVLNPLININILTNTVSVGGQAFYLSEDITTITSNITGAIPVYSLFVSSPEKIVLFVPRGTTQVYRDAGWGDFIILEQTFIFNNVTYRSTSKSTAIVIGYDTASGTAVIIPSTLANSGVALM